MPKESILIYASFVYNYQPLKEESHRVRIIIGGDRLLHDDDVDAPLANLLETKLLINSTMSDSHKGARFISIDIKDHFLATFVKTPKYMRAKYKYIPNDIKIKCNLDSKLTKDRYIYIKIKKGMPGLK